MKAKKITTITLFILMVSQVWSQTVFEKKHMPDYEKILHGVGDVVWSDNDLFETGEPPHNPSSENKVLRKNGNPFIKDPLISSKNTVKFDNVITLCEHITIPI